MATSDADSSIASDSDFDPAQYEPAALQYEPIGLKLYNPGDVAYEPEVVLREPNKHLSVYNREVKKRSSSQSTELRVNTEQAIESSCRASLMWSTSSLCNDPGYSLTALKMQSMYFVFRVHVRIGSYPCQHSNGAD